MSEPLSNYIKLQGGFAFKSSDFQEEGISLIRISNITNNGLDRSDVVFLHSEYANQLEEFLGNEDDTLIAMSGATTGKCNQWSINVLRTRALG